MSKYLIYGLFCPFTNNLHYVGKSSSYLTRPLQHLNDSHSEKIKEWVNQLKLLNYKPIIKILEECNEDNINEIEKKWIQKSCDDGCYLLNIAHNTTKEILSQELYYVNDIDIINIGNIIKKERISQNITQNEICNKAGITRSTLWHIEKGSNTINYDSLKKVLNVLNFEINIRKKS